MLVLLYAHDRDRIQYVEVASFVRRLATAEAARIGSYSVWPPLRCVSTASLTIVVRGVQLPFRAGTDLLAVGELCSTTSSPQGLRQQ